MAQDKSIQIRDRLISTIGAITSGTEYNCTIAKATADNVSASEPDDTPFAVIDSERDEYEDTASKCIRAISYYNISVKDKSPLDDDYQQKQGLIAVDIKKAIQRDSTLQNAQGGLAIRTQVTRIDKTLADDEGWFAIVLLVEARYFITFREGN